MSIMDELKKLTRPYDDDSTLMDDDIDLDGEMDEPTYARPTAAAAPVATPVDAPINMGGVGGVGNMGGMGGMGTMNEPARTPVSTINMGSGPDISKYRVVLVKPEEFDCAPTIAKHICQGDAIILNCEDTSDLVARRVVDFLSGCAFALDGSIKKAANDVYIIAPKDVGVDDAKDGDELKA